MTMALRLTLTSPNDGCLSSSRCRQGCHAPRPRRHPPQGHDSRFDIQRCHQAGRRSALDPAHHHQGRHKRLLLNQSNQMITQYPDSIGIARCHQRAAKNSALAFRQLRLRLTGKAAILAEQRKTSVPSRIVHGHERLFCVMRIGRCVSRTRVMYAERLLRHSENGMMSSLGRQQRIGSQELLIGRRHDGSWTNN